MQPLAYQIVDVFTETAFTGNPLAVVFGADRLGTAQMQAIAKEFNLSETVFALPPTQASATYRARIFTAETELPFAGHPSVGVAVTQMRAGLFPAGEVIQECGAGLLPITVTADGSATVHGGQPTLGPELDPGPLLAAVGLTAADFAGPAPRMAGCGLEFPHLSVRSEALAHCAGDGSVARAHKLFDVSVFAWDPDTRSSRTRVFFGSGMTEDPATGSAALGFGVYLVANGLLPADGESAYRVRQGIEIGRPSTLDCTVTAAGGTALSATVRGSVVPIAAGEIAVPSGA
jgi:trans-2,3-dihydro-3-hydroxyanthranilate isomerase